MDTAGSCLQRFKQHAMIIARISPAAHPPSATMVIDNGSDQLSDPDDTPAPVRAGADVGLTLTIVLAVFEAVASLETLVLIAKLPVDSVDFRDDVLRRPA